MSSEQGDPLQRCSKVLQRHSNSLFSSRRGTVVVLVAGLLTLDAVVGWVIWLFRIQRDSNSSVWDRDSVDNIAEKNFNARLCSSPIDLVYTWVNGSDPWLQANVLFYRSLEESEGRVDNSPEALARRAADLENAAGASRFEDHDELRYSLRSVERYAPWIRRIYIVTNGQVPSWLDVSHPRIMVVPHHDLFPNVSELPTFSSPAIECHLHRIPGLSERFVYLNDDVMFGAPVWPDDFWTNTDGHRIWLSWPVPDCTEYCSQNWLGDGYCDKKCNTSTCGWDAGDCIGPNVKFGYGGGDFGEGNGAGDLVDGDPLKMQGGEAEVVEEDQCAPGCPDGSIGDTNCDPECDCTACGHDAFDCGLAGIDDLWTVKPSALPQTVPGAVDAFVVDLTGHFSSVERGSAKNDASGVLRVAAIAHNSGKWFLVVVLTHGSVIGPVQFEVVGTVRNGGKGRMTLNLTLGDTPKDARDRAVGEAGEADPEWQAGGSVPDIPISVIRESGTASLSTRRRLHQVSVGVRRKLLAAARQSRLAMAAWQRSGAAPGRRRLLDTYGDSLKFVNRLMDKRFDRQQRYVPAHMPHFIDTQVVREMQTNWAEQFAATSRRKFRSGEDMQFAFTHFYWIMNARNAKAGEFFFRDVLDMNGDGYLQPNEMRHMAAMLWEKRVSRSDLQSILDDARDGAQGSAPQFGAPVAAEADDGTWSLGANSGVRKAGRGEDTHHVPSDFPPLVDASLEQRRRLLQLYADEDDFGGRAVTGNNYDMGGYEDMGGYGGYGTKVECHNETIWVQVGDKTEPVQREVCEHVSAQDDWATPAPTPSDPLGSLGPPMNAEFVGAVSELVDLAKSGLKEGGRSTGRSWSRLLTAPFFNGSHLAGLLMKGELEKRYKYRMAPEGDESGVAFLMVTNNATVVRRKLDRVAAQRQKFICMNDNLNASDATTQEVVKVLRNFLNDYFPDPSSFELRGGSTNTFAHTWEAPEELRHHLGWTDPLRLSLDPVYATSFPRHTPALGDSLPWGALLPFVGGAGALAGLLFLALRRRRLARLPT
eukprot:Hpha_TRINITY_DN33568_c0_g1::TRINITY_DN33568_c0_g1_i1::g.171199::m.171199/K08239/GNPTAB; UDP-N-acetylglucosamine-lysosomal-enzyme